MSVWLNSSLEQSHIERNIFNFITFSNKASRSHHITSRSSECVCGRCRVGSCPTAWFQSFWSLYSSGQSPPGLTELVIEQPSNRARFLFAGFLNIANLQTRSHLLTLNDPLYSVVLVISEHSVDSPSHPPGSLLHDELFIIHTRFESLVIQHSSS